MKPLFWRGLSVGLLVLAADAALGTELEILSAPADPEIHGVRGNDASYNCQITDDGLTAVFDSFAFQLVAGDTNGARDIFVRDHVMGATERISVDVMGGEVSVDASLASISGDGRLIAFSVAADLSGTAATNVNQVYLFDRDSGALSLVSRTLGGGFGNRDSDQATISTNGGHIAFRSDATNLVAADVNAQSDTFVYDVATGTVSLVSVTATGTQADLPVYGSEISADGSVIAFQTTSTTLDPGDTNGTHDVYVKHMPSGMLRRASVDSAGSEGAGYSELNDLAEDGLAVAFTTSNPFVGTDTNGLPDVYLHQFVAASTERLSETLTGTDANAASSNALLGNNGRRVVFESFATNLVVGTPDPFPRLYLRDLDAGTLVALPTDNERSAVATDFNPAGTRLCFTTYGTGFGGTDYNGNHDVYVLNIENGSMELASRSESGLPTTVGNSYSRRAAVSADGNLVVFDSRATDLEADPDAFAGTSRIYLRDVNAATIDLVAAVPGGADYSMEQPDISADGRFVVFESYATNLLPPDDMDSDVFSVDRQTGALIRISEAVGGGPGHGEDASVSIGLRRVVFMSRSDLLLDPADNNGKSDIYLWDLGAIRRVSVAADGGGADGDSRAPRISDDGNILLFKSTAGNITDEVPEGGENLFFGSADEPTPFCLTCSSNLFLGGYDLSHDGGRVAFFAAPNGVTVPPFGQPGVFLYERASNQLVRLPIPLPGNLIGMDFVRLSGDGSTLVGVVPFGQPLAPPSDHLDISLGNADNLVFRYRIDTGELVDVLAGAPGHVGMVDELALNHDGSRIVVSADGALLPQLDRNRNGTQDVYAITYHPGSIAVELAGSMDENIGTISVSLLRASGSDGLVRATLVGVDGTALAGEDYIAFAQEVEWASGETGARTVEVKLIDDALEEATETFDVHINAVAGGAGISVATQTVTIVDHDADRIFANGFDAS